ncbi:tRNA (mnm(5)s(2)U34)-methyltransferase [Alkalilimnicola ehrlichii MLHE-1]|uniref:Putative rRNA methylase n=1 Tax=Alkalilimnicola ehrlichii (strain ATCC BAA-1101 / DSM 17681 / MLHE-1) TaxID=187272 RepID=Q0A8H3_ALKEH|nr:class I SAM-dependent methyltransferase [Alkalilimnicola ehrlichii]ABI56864.1 putative rRNA methylase [Alkalilimnicola ehrlichii MLHE-1]
MAHRRLTALAHARLAARLRAGDRAVDATAGNGHDTVFLADQVGASGHVWAFDIQPTALAATRQRLRARGLASRATLVAAGHETLAEHLPPQVQGGLAAVMFNLGYLPGGDRALVTRPETTRAALSAAWRALAPGGVISLMIYRGHPGGEQEYQALRDWCSGLGVTPEVPGGPPASDRAPIWWVLQRPRPCPPRP